MTALLAAELAFLLGTGLAAGTFFGVSASRIFIPYLQVGAEMAERFPPFVVRIAWPAIFEMYLLFGFLFIAALGALVGLLLRMKVFQAIKLGETV
jgi:putative ABC transport system permease protein